MRRARLGLAVVVLGSLALARAAAGGGVERLIEVAIPVQQSFEEPYRMRHHTVRCTPDSILPGLEISYTTHPAYAVGDRHFNRMDSAQRNAAWEAGVRVTIESVPRPRWKRLPRASRADSAGGRLQFADTLLVTIDVANAFEQMQRDTAAIRRSGQANVAESAGRGDEEDARVQTQYTLEALERRTRQFEGLVRCTRACILDNASRSHPPIRNVRLEILGADHLKRLEGVIPVKSAPPDATF